jgi:hypothetical protein
MSTAKAEPKAPTGVGSSAWLGIELILARHKAMLCNFVLLKNKGVTMSPTVTLLEEEKPNIVCRIAPCLLWPTKTKSNLPLRHTQVQMTKPKPPNPNDEMLGDIRCLTVFRRPMVRILILLQAPHNQHNSFQYATTG